jgi:hypothetical protein
MRRQFHQLENFPIYLIVLFFAGKTLEEFANKHHVPNEFPPTTNGEVCDSSETTVKRSSDPSGDGNIPSQAGTTDSLANLDSGVVAREGEKNEDVKVKVNSSRCS